MKKYFKILYIIGLSSLLSCALVEKRRQPMEQKYTEYFSVSVEELSALLSEHILNKYELNAEAGGTFTFQTVPSSKPHPFQHKLFIPKEEQRSELTIELADLTSPADLKAGFGQRTRISILKTVESKRGTFQEWVKTPSDGLEEEAILYRLHRLIQLKKSGKL
ncbi:MAG: hypothetical protein HYS98_05265 [Deltaproteobacteria bacterium]|nr:hypothetical protein [Deltaproteobacteria bacterium]